MIDYLAAFAAITDFEHPWRYGEVDTDVLDGFYRTLEAEQQLAATVAYPSEAARILAIGQAAFGDLRGLLAGQPDDLLDQEPKPGEWPLRKTIHHALHTELSFRANVRYSLTRRPDEPVKMPAELRPGPDAADASGGTVDLLTRFAVERERTDAEFEALGPDDLLKTSIWTVVEADVRFRLNRFGGHLAEHTIQCEKTLRWLGREPGEARMIVRRMSYLRGLHERYTDPAVLDRVDAENRRRAADFVS